MRDVAAQGCAGLAAVVLPAVGLDCASVRQAVERLEAAAAARAPAGGRLSLLHLAVRLGSPALVRPRLTGAFIMVGRPGGGVETSPSAMSSIGSPRRGGACMQPGTGVGWRGPGMTEAAAHMAALVC